MNKKNNSSIKCSLCTIPIEELGFWAEKRFINKTPTLELLKQAKTDRDKEIITVVGMLDVDDEQLYQMLGAAKETDCNIFACRQKLKTWLKKKIEFSKD